MASRTTTMYHTLYACEPFEGMPRCTNQYSVANTDYDRKDTGQFTADYIMDVWWPAVIKGDYSLEPQHPMGLKPVGYTAVTRTYFSREVAGCYEGERIIWVNTYLIVDGKPTHELVSQHYNEGRHSVSTR